MIEGATPVKQPGSNVQGTRGQESGTIEPHSLRVPPLLSQLIDQLVEREQYRSGMSTEAARRAVEALVIREGIAAAQREVSA